MPSRADNRCTLAVQNGDSDKTRVTSATLALDGVTVVGPADFKKSAARIEKAVALKPQNTLTVELADKPGSFIVVSVTYPTSANTPPVANAGPDQTVPVPSTVQLDGSGSRDADGDPVTYRWSLTARPDSSVATLSNTEQVQASFTPDVAGDYVAQLIVNDGTLDSEPDSALVTVTATTPTNRAPEITSTPVTQATVGQLYSYQVAATDPDAGDVLTYSLATNPEGMTIDAATGLIQWTPSQAGGTNVEVRVTDQGGLSDSQSFPITVAAAPDWCASARGTMILRRGDGRRRTRFCSGEGMRICMGMWMDVIDMPVEIVWVADWMPPKPPLPNRTFPVFFLGRIHPFLSME